MSKVKERCDMTLLKNKVKMMYIRAQSAGLSEVTSTLPNSIERVFYSNSREYSTAVGFTPFDNLQRLKAEDLMWFVGFVEGDGAFSVNKNGKYAKYEFCIEVSKRDVQLLYKIKSMLGIGSVNCRKRDTIETARFKISSKPNLIRIIVPIFDKYNMLTSKHFDFIHFKYCLLNNIVYFVDVPRYTRPSDLPVTVKDILCVPYFDCWLVGFIEAKASFTAYSVTRERYATTTHTIEFVIQLNLGLLILTAIKERLSIRANPFLSEYNYKLKTTSTRGIQNIINFLKQTPVKLKGYKRAQYLKWLHSLRTNPNYNRRSVNVPKLY